MVLAEGRAEITTSWTGSGHGQDASEDHERPLLAHDARMDIGWSLRSNRYATLCWRPPVTREKLAVRGRHAEDPVQPVSIDVAALRQVPGRD